MEQARRLQQLERRLEAMDAARRADRAALVNGLDLLAEAIRECAARVLQLEAAHGMTGDSHGAAIGRG
jgi:hypothetical protein